ncbi:MAG: prepilin-type N-terminal cleavage/methylation domain-containing protein [Planctomycetota bacterium]
MHQRKKNIGFTLIELMVVIVILGIIGTTAFVFVFNKPAEANWSRARSEMLEISKALGMYATSNGGEFPEDLSVLEGKGNAFPNGLPKDPFSKEVYDYEPLEDDFTLTCLGKDGAEGGEAIPDKDIFVNAAGVINNDEG